MPHKLQFKVIHASGQDDVFRASELNHHSPLTKGWQSSRHGLATRIKVKIEEDSNPVPPIFSPYVSLSDNEKTGYKARELKSVHVDAAGYYLKLNIHKNHVNKYNLYNQVGIIAINVIGEPVRKNNDLTDPELLLEDNRLDRDPALEGFFNKPDYISPLDDLAFDMYQDPEIAHIIRRLERKKQEAVLQEKYDFAKRLKVAITELQKVGEKLGKMEVEKRQAVENEDYDKAKVKKLQMDEYRLQIYKELDLNKLLEVSGSQEPQPLDLQPIRQATPPYLVEITHRSSPRYEDQPLPRRSIEETRSQYVGETNTFSVIEEARLRNKNNLSFKEARGPDVSETNAFSIIEEMPLPNTKSLKAPLAPEPSEAPNDSPREEPPVENKSNNNSPRSPYDERRLPVHKPKALIEEETPLDDPSQEPEPMTEVDLREASTAIDVFGLSLVSKAYSKTWSYREDALTSVYRQMQEIPVGNKEEAKSILRAAIFLVKRGIDDKVYAVFKAALNLLRMILTDFVSRHRLGKADITLAVERSMPNLHHKAGETAIRHRDDAKNFVIEMASFPEVKPTNSVTHECVKPFKLTLGPRHAQSRCELVESLYKKFGLKNGLTMDNVMGFNVQALQHNAGEPRDVTERLIKQMYKDHGAPVKDYLPSDDEKTRKNTLWRQLFEYFDQVDGKPSKADLKKKKAEEESKKQAEIDALQKQLQQLRDMNAGKAPIDQKVLKNEPKKPAAKPGPKKADVKPKPKPKASNAKDDDDVSMFTVDNICIFCGERNESFTEEGLDVHYWKNCPMLKRCTNCKQVVEIATYTDHLLTECEAKSNFSKCPRCSEAIPKPEFDQHVAEKTCSASKAGLNHCPLCHENIPSGEDGWKDHLMGKSGCKQNPRRLLAPGKPAGGGGAAKPAAKGRGGKSGIPAPKGRK